MGEAAYRSRLGFEGVDLGSPAWIGTVPGAGQRNHQAGLVEQAGERLGIEPGVQRGGIQSARSSQRVQQATGGRVASADGVRDRDGPRGPTDCDIRARPPASAIGARSHDDQLGAQVQPVGGDDGAAWNIAANDRDWRGPVRDLAIQHTARGTTVFQYEFT